MTPNRPPRPLVIDCDPGVDDAVALAVTAGSSEVDLRAVTTVAGNVPLAMTTANALRLLRAFGREDVPVAAGAARALVRLPEPHPPVHGSNGLGGVELPGPVGEPAGHAVERLACVLREAPRRSVTIAALGPLTNIALLLALHPDLTERIDRLMIMGGAAGPGNVTPVAEFNVWADPEAAQRVLATPDLDIRLVALDVTRRATVDEATLAALRARSRRGALLADMIGGYGDDSGPDGWPMHDALVVAAIVDPAVIETRPALVEVDTGTGLGRAQTLIAFDMPIEGWGGHGFPVVAPSISPRLQVAVDVDVDRFRAILLERVDGAA